MGLMCAAGRVYCSLVHWSHAQISTFTLAAVGVQAARLTGEEVTVFSFQATQIFESGL